MSSSASTASQTGFDNRIERRIALARAAILWERIWPALWPASGIAGLFAALALLGLFAHLPVWLDFLLTIAAACAAAYFFGKGFETFRAPDRSEAARRVERDSALAHRPITERDDLLAAGGGDRVAESLWAAHRRALLARRDRLHFAVPHATLAERDPYRLRFAIPALLIAGVFVAGPDWAERLGSPFLLGASGPAATLDAWIDPPAYTGEAPIYLPRGTGAHAVAAPEGSTLALRVHGARTTPRLMLSPRPEGALAFAGHDREYAANGKLTGDESVTVNAGGATLGLWRIKAIPDEPPSIAFSQPPSRTERDAVKFAFTAGDDYGVVSARALIAPVKKTRKARILVVDLPLSSSGKTVRQTVYRDLTANAYAGLPVEITLEAKDAAGHIGRSAPARFTLPERVFTNPLARALVEQRRNLALNGRAGVKPVTLALDALTIAPEMFYRNATGVYLAIRAAFWGLKHARNDADIAGVESLLWQTALALEKGELTSAAEELRRLQQLLSQALAQGAPQPVIDALLQRYRQALNDYLQMLARNPPPPGAPLPKGAKVLKPQDLQALLRAIQQLSQTGARDRAQQLLALLQSLLENLRMTAGAGSGGSQQDKALSDAVKGLGDLMGRQRQLLDKTFRESQGNPDPKDGGAKGLAQQQGNLRQRLDKLMQGLGPKAGSGAKELGQAGKQMGEAQGQLGRRALDNATGAERGALESMRKGAGQLAKQLMNENGRQDAGGNADPLGRENGGRGPDFGGETKLPSRSQMERARGILKELRKRAAERGRPKEELDYIDRLLKQF